MTRKELERKLQLMKRIPAKTYRGVDKDVVAVWQLADGSMIMKRKEIYTKQNSKRPSRHLYVRYVQDGSRLVDADEFYTMTEVRRFASKIRRTEAVIRYHDQENAIDAGLQEAEVIYKDLKAKYKGEHLKKALKAATNAAIKYWRSKRSISEYGMYAYGVAKGLERKSR